MTTDNRTNEPTPGQEVAAKAMWDLRKLSNDPEWDDLEYGVRNEYRKDARAALVAAQGAAPQAEGENAAVARAIRIWTRQVRSELEATAEANIRLGEDYLHGIRSALMQAEDHAARLENDLYGDKPTPVLPSSGVDEDKLAEVIGRLDWGYMVDGPSVSEIARAVVEWLEEQG